MAISCERTPPPMWRPTGSRPPTSSSEVKSRSLLRSKLVVPVSPPVSTLSCIHQFSPGGIAFGVMVGLVLKNWNTEPVTKAPSPTTRSPPIGSLTFQPLWWPAPGVQSGVLAVDEAHPDRQA